MTDVVAELRNSRLAVPVEENGRFSAASAPDAVIEPPGEQGFDRLQRACLAHRHTRREWQRTAAPLRGGASSREARSPPPGSRTALESWRTSPDSNVVKTWRTWMRPAQLR